MCPTSGCESLGSTPLADLTLLIVILLKPSCEHSYGVMHGHTTTLVRGVSHQLYNLDTRLYQSVSLDYNYLSCATPTCALSLTDCQPPSVMSQHLASAVASSHPHCLLLLIDMLIAPDTVIKACTVHLVT